MPKEGPASRPIRPRAEAGGSSTAGNTSPTSSSSTAGVRPSSTHRTNIRSACAACRRRRSKCSGDQPCNRCRAHDTDCIYNEAQDGRTRAIRDRGREELNLHRTVFSGVFQAIREGREHDLLELIRSGAPLETIAAAIEDPISELSSETASETSEQPTPSRTLHTGNTPLPYLSRFEGYPNMPVGLESSAQTFPDNSTTIVPGPSAQNPVALPNDAITELRHMFQPLHLRDPADTRNWSSIYITFRDTTQQMIAHGVPPISILGSSDISCDLMFNRSQAAFGVSTWACSIVNSVRGVDMIFRLAWLCCITRFIKWTIQPTKENFDLLPRVIIPTAMQLSVAHLPMIDLIPLPQIRDSMIGEFRDFTSALEFAGATFDWSESIDEAIRQDPVTGRMTITAKFETHVSDSRNFWFGKSILQVFPELSSQLCVADTDQIPHLADPATLLES